jgi:hypothetical protein
MIKKILVFTLVILSLGGFSQENIIKLGMSGVGYGNFALKYERAVTAKNSLSLTVGYLNQDMGLFTNDYSTVTDGGIIIDSLGRGFHTSLDYRFYLGKEERTKGFYLAPYLRYWNYSFHMLDEIRLDYFDVDAKISSIGIGFQMGFHWIVYDKISIDWSFFGLGVAYMNPRMVYSIDKENFNYSTIEQDIRDVFDGWDYFEKRLVTTPGENNLVAKLSTLFPGIRMGISIGYAF